MKQTIPNKLQRIIDDMLMPMLSLGQLADDHDPALEIECNFISEHGEWFIFHDFIGAN